MRLTPFLLLSPWLLACGTDPTTSTATDSGSTGPSTTQEDPTTPGSDPTTGTTADVPTGGSASMTDSGSTTDASATSTGSTTDGPTTDTDPVQTDTGPDPVTSTGPDPGTSTGPGPGTDSGSSTGPDSDSDTDSESSTGGDELCACPDLEVPLDDGIFVLSDDAELWKFFPEFDSFEILGPVSCDLPPSTFSMAVDRTGFAWVQYSGGDLRKVAVTDVTDCTNPGYLVGQQNVFNFGMAFVSNSATDACDRIYGNEGTGVAEGPGISTFFSIDPDSLLIDPLGPSDYGTAEVTGTGDGRAFLFAGANPAKLIEVNKDTGAKLDVLPLTGVELGDAWAFAFFGGDFYFFTNNQGGFGSEVTHLDYDDSDMNGQQDLTVVVPDAPIRIVGAGVSTCAPTAPQ